MQQEAAAHCHFACEPENATRFFSCKNKAKKTTKQPQPTQPSVNSAKKRCKKEAAPLSCFAYG